MKLIKTIMVMLFGLSGVQSMASHPEYDPSEGMLEVVYTEDNQVGFEEMMREEGVTDGSTEQEFFVVCSPGDKNCHRIIDQFKLAEAIVLPNGKIIINPPLKLMQLSALTEEQLWELLHGRLSKVIF